MMFWLGKGIAGFRMDVINAISKAEGLPDKDPHKKGLQFPGELTLNRPKTHEYLREMYDKVLSHYDCMALGEGTLARMEDVILYTKPERHELQMMFQFDLHNVGYGRLGKYDFRKLYRYSIKTFKNIIIAWDMSMQEGNGWIGNYLSNHDQRRHISRFGDDKKYREESAKALCLLNFTLRGTPFIYQGEEIGMTDCDLLQEDWRDYEAINAYKVLQFMMHVPAFIAKKIVNKVTRDNSRTPMQWSSENEAGFTKGKPWIKVNPNYREINVEDELTNKQGILSFYKKTIAFHKEHPVFIRGAFRPVLEEDKKVIGYIREDDTEKLLIIINLTKKEAKVDGSNKNIEQARIIYHTHQKPPLQNRTYLKLQPYEGIVYKFT